MSDTVYHLQDNISMIIICSVIVWHSSDNVYHYYNNIIIITFSVTVWQLVWHSSDTVYYLQDNMYDNNVL